METDKKFIDQEFLREITGGDDELLTELVTLFVRDLPHYRQSMNQSIADGNRLRFNQLAHKFRSSLNSLAMLGAAQALHEMENDGRSLDGTFMVRLTDLFQGIGRGVTILGEQLEQNITE